MRQEIDDEKEQAATRANESYAATERMLYNKPYRCDFCGHPIAYKGICAVCVEEPYDREDGPDDPL